MIGRHYQVPMVSFRDAWWPELTAGRAVWEEMYADVVHPNDTGHVLASELLISLLEHVNKQAPARGTLPQVNTELPPPMISDIFADCEFYRYEHVKPVENKGWTRTADKKYWESAAAGGVLELDFTGRVLFLGFDMGKGVESRVTFSIDGGAAQVLKPDGHRRPIASNLAPGRHCLRIELDDKQPAAGSTDKIRVWAVGGAGCRL